MSSRLVLAHPLNYLGLVSVRMANLVQMTQRYVCLLIRHQQLNMALMISRMFQTEQEQFLGKLRVFSHHFAISVEAGVPP